MPAITVKNIPDKLYTALKASAESNHRSINSEILICLEQQLHPARMPPADRLERIQSLRASTGKKGFSSIDISKAIKSGRP